MHRGNKDGNGISWLTLCGKDKQGVEQIMDEVLKTIKEIKWTKKAWEQNDLDKSHSEGVALGIEIALEDLSVAFRKESEKAKKRSELAEKLELTETPSTELINKIRFESWSEACEK